MGIINKLFKWFKAKDKEGKEMNLGYVLDDEPKNMDDIKKLFKAFGLTKYLEKIKPLIRPKIDLELQPCKEDNFNNPTSKIGGQPFLPLNFSWPKDELEKSLSFIGQLNCEEVSKYDSTNLFPTTGLISFFYCANQDAWGYDPNHKTRFKVLYFENLKELIKTNFPSDLETHSIYLPNNLTFNSCLSIPPFEYVPDDLIMDDDSDDYNEVSFGSENQIFGYANHVQNPMEIQCQSIESNQGSDSGDNFEQLFNETRNNEWMLLLQLDSEEDKTGMMWGDCGRIYFWIKKQDLKNKKFENVWCILQCH